jgi:hypothetical protein
VKAVPGSHAQSGQRGGRVVPRERNRPTAPSAGRLEPDALEHRCDPRDLGCGGIREVEVTGRERYLALRSEQGRPLQRAAAEPRQRRCDREHGHVVATLREPEQGKPGLRITTDRVGTLIGLLRSVEVAATSAELAERVHAVGDDEDIDPFHVAAHADCLDLGLLPGSPHIKDLGQCTRQIPGYSDASGRGSHHRRVVSVHSTARRWSTSS